MPAKARHASPLDLQIVLDVLSALVTVSVGRLLPHSSPRIHSQGGIHTQPTYTSSQQPAAIATDPDPL
jgi:hypothetical protein